jgi:hypothetical protein
MRTKIPREVENHEVRVIVNTGSVRVIADEIVE